MATTFSGVPPKPDYTDVQPPAPKVSLLCAPSGGADRVYVQTFPPEGGTVDQASLPDTAVGFLGSRYKVPDGDCSSGELAFSPWSLGGSSLSNGYVVCLPSTGFDDRSWIYWSFGKGKVLAFATRDDGDYATLYTWWRRLITFLQ